jgi:hypothetical protein
MHCVCAVQAVMLRGASPLSRCAWRRGTREAPGRHREVGSEGRVEQTCGARDMHPIRGMVQSGRAGMPQDNPPSTHGLCLINRALMHRQTADHEGLLGCPWTWPRIETG